MQEKPSFSGVTKSQCKYRTPKLSSQVQDYSRTVGGKAIQILTFCDGKSIEND